MKPSNLLRLVDASADRVTVSFDVPTSDTSRTVLGLVKFDRLTCELTVMWTVDGRKSLTVADRLGLMFWSLSLVRSIVRS